MSRGSRSVSSTTGPGASRCIFVQEAELERGDKVAIDSLNSPEYLETFFAALKLGCVPVNVNYRYLADEVHYVVDNADAKAVVHGPQFAETVKEALKRIQKPWRPFTLETGKNTRRSSRLRPGRRSGHPRTSRRVMT